jgi:hypothetical protein
MNKIYPHMLFRTKYGLSKSGNILRSIPTYIWWKELNTGLLHMTKVQLSKNLKPKNGVRIKEGEYRRE